MAQKKHGTRRGVVFFAENISAQVLTVGGNDLLVPVKTLFLIAVPGAGAVVVAVFVVVPTSSSSVAFGAAAKSFSAVVIVFSVLMVNPYYAISVVSFVAICDCNLRLRLRFAVRRLLRRESSE